MGFRHRLLKLRHGAQRSNAIAAANGNHNAIQHLYCTFGHGGMKGWWNWRTLACRRRVNGGGSTYPSVVSINIAIAIAIATPAVAVVAELLMLTTEGY
eukprot:CAMPEP_0119066954 /NCGR_PEP_ID=MMETSP1178-20130426/9346_2 /TAXON_ID=33656 /ORGANISM="unid sp, Strain CCMP2000" /LENGTH=97 /DNA_ID=CAMNT_0007048585 /DNA_START=526 /DNA_END=817 /DNA_ORIENTATION=-